MQGVVQENGGHIEHVVQLHCIRYLYNIQNGSVFSLQKTSVSHITENFRNAVDYGTASFYASPLLL